MIRAPPEKWPVVACVRKPFCRLRRAAPPPRPLPLPPPNFDECGATQINRPNQADKRTPFALAFAAAAAGRHGDGAEVAEAAKAGREQQIGRLERVPIDRRRLLYEPLGLVVPCEFAPAERGAAAEKLEQAACKFATRLKVTTTSLSRRRRPNPSGNHKISGH